MALKTYEEYVASLKKLRPNIYKFDELIEDVTTHPATRRTVEGHGWSYKASHDDRYKHIFTTKSHLTGETVSRSTSLIQSAEDMFANSDMKRTMFQLSGTCTGGRCAGWTAMNAMYGATYDMDKDLGTDYHERLKNWMKHAQAEDLTVAGALTDPKGDRTKPPHLQDDEDLFLHLVEKRDDGIVVRGAKVMICGVAASHEIFVMPGSAYREEDADVAVSFAIPRDTEGLTIVETRRPSDTRDLEEGFDNPITEGGITQAYLLFEDVFVPKERVFMCGETKYTLNSIMTFVSTYRAAIGGCVAGQGDIKIGSAILTARSNGLSSKVFTDKIIQMHINNETTYGMGIAAAARGRQHESGVWLCDPLLANVNKVHVATMPYQTSVLAQDIAGGIAETGCIPSYKDFKSDKYGHLIQKYLKAKHSADSRTRAARLVEWTTIGGGVPGCMHGGGSPDGAKLVIRGAGDLEKKVEIARRLAGITEEIPDPAAKKK